MRSDLHDGTISVVIPTHLPRCLDRTLDALSGQSDPDFEVVVIENGERSDGVDAVCERWRGRLNLRYRYDPRAGLNRARNTGLRMASGEYTALLDDDCRPSERWVETIRSNFKRMPGAAVIGGPIRLEFDSPPPDWLVGEFRTCLSELDHGRETRVLTGGEFMFGANIALTKEVFQETGGFMEGIGMNTRKPPQLANDETVFLETVSRGSESRIVYCPEMSVAHHIPRSRVSLRSMFNRRYGQGVSDVALMRWRHGAKPDKTVERYLNGVFPHPRHLRQLENRLHGLVPLTAQRYLRNHVLCRVGYLWGYRRALSELLDSQGGHPGAAAGPGSRLPGRIGHAYADKAPQALASDMADLMYRKASGSRNVRRADGRLRLLVAMGHCLEPALFTETPLGLRGAAVV